MYLPALVHISMSTEASCPTAFSSVANHDFVPTISKNAMSVPASCKDEPPVAVPIRGQLRLPYFQPCLIRTVFRSRGRVPTVRRVARQVLPTGYQSCYHSNQKLAPRSCLHWTHTSDCCSHLWPGLRNHMALPIPELTI